MKASQSRSSGTLSLPQCVGAAVHNTQGDLGQHTLGIGRILKARELHKDHDQGICSLVIACQTVALLTAINMSFMVDAADCLCYY